MSRHLRPGNAAHGWPDTRCSFSLGACAPATSSEGKRIVQPARIGLNELLDCSVQISDYLILLKRRFRTLPDLIEKPEMRFLTSRVNIVLPISSGFANESTKRGDSRKSPQ